MRILAAYVLLTLGCTAYRSHADQQDQYALKAEAKKAYLKNDFKTLFRKYRYLVDSINVRKMKCC
jgi:hypothetical protein